MPTYKNTSQTPIIYNNTVFKFLVPTEIDSYINLDDFPTLIKVSDEPIYQPVVFSQMCTSGTTFDVLSNKTKDTSLIRIISKDPYSEVTFNIDSGFSVGISDNSPLELHDVSKYNIIYVKSGNVNIELWKSFDWRY